MTLEEIIQRLELGPHFIVPNDDVLAELKRYQQLRKHHAIVEAEVMDLRKKGAK